MLNILEGNRTFHGEELIIPPLRQHDDTYGFRDYKKAEELSSYFASISRIND